SRGESTVKSINIAPHAATPRVRWQCTACPEIAKRRLLHVPGDVPPLAMQTRFARADLPRFTVSPSPHGDPLHRSLLGLSAPSRHVHLRDQALRARRSVAPALGTAPHAASP